MRRCDSLSRNVHWVAADNSLSFSTAADRIVYISWHPRRRRVWVDRRGRELGTVGDPAADFDSGHDELLPELSGDQRHILTSQTPADILVTCFRPHPH